MISIGIDIGTYSIKVARIEGSSKNFQVLNLEEYPLTQDPTKDNSIDVLEALRNIKQRYISEGTHVVISARQNHLSFRKRFFPFKERHKILRSLPFELEDDIPLSIETALFEAKITSYVGEGANVLAAVCPKAHVLERIKPLDDADIIPNILSPEAVALSNNFETWLESIPTLPVQDEDAEAAESTAYVHIGHNETICSIIQDGTLLDAFTVDWGGSDIADSIKIKYSLQYQEAIKELKKKGYILTSDEGASDDQIVFSDIIKSTVDQLATPLKLNLLESEASLNTKISNIYLTGGTALLKNLGPYLTQKLEIATNRVSRVERFPNFDFNTSPNNEISYLIALGLAAEGLRRPKNPATNLLKGDLAPQNQSMKVFWETWSTTFRAVAAIFVIFFIWAFIRESVALNIADQANEVLKTQAENVAGLKGRQASRRNIRRHIREQENLIQQKELLDSLQDVNSALDVFNRATNLFPKASEGKIKVTEFNVKNDTVSIAGEVDKPSLVTQIQNNLKQMAINNRVESAKPGKALKPQNRAFNFRFQVARRSGD